MAADAEPAPVSAQGQRGGSALSLRSGLQFVDYEEASAMLLEKIDRWEAEIRQAGRQEGGRQEGRMETIDGLLRARDRVAGDPIRHRHRRADLPPPQARLRQRHGAGRATLSLPSVRHFRHRERGVPDSQDTCRLPPAGRAERSCAEG